MHFEDSVFLNLDKLNRKVSLFIQLTFPWKNLFSMAQQKLQMKGEYLEQLKKVKNVTKTIIHA